VDGLSASGGGGVCARVLSLHIDGSVAMSRAMSGPVRGTGELVGDVVGDGTGGANGQPSGAGGGTADDSSDGAGGASDGRSNGVSDGGGNVHLGGTSLLQGAQDTVVVVMGAGGGEVAGTRVACAGSTRVTSAGGHAIASLRSRHVGGLGVVLETKIAQFKFNPRIFQLETFSHGNLTHYLTFWLQVLHNQPV
jgi:hypothetical protein